ncbi:hypothetical protein [Pyxidicoccus xibeiensis]|uniref:hypothetical protein n=1 Tax=Pyxidicoccus xibeiensis TaxID=2906759 RepID=UPI0020A73EB7|nr:hypothetical protein [Pyxidicoccus xibeiensis]MCP3140838.1 hypothetical protein [Pyxidicoccus xibeiensis]
MERQLTKLTTAGVDRVGEVLAEHGWAGRSQVGCAAADAECRLVLTSSARGPFPL